MFCEILSEEFFSEFYADTLSLTVLATYALTSSEDDNSSEYSSDSD